MRVWSTLRQNFGKYFSWENLNPLNWSTREIKLFLGTFLAIMLPVYLFIGLQPALPADAASYPQLEISSINLKTPVAKVELVNRKLEAPATIAGIYQGAANKLFIIGHSSTVFQKLHQVRVNDTIIYNEKSYRITELQTLAKADIDMGEILQAEPTETLIIMTCAGEPLPNQDATHRLIVTAALIE